MGFVLGKRFSGGKLIYQEFPQQTPHHSSTSWPHAVLFCS